VVILERGAAFFTGDGDQMQQEARAVEVAGLADTVERLGPLPWAGSGPTSPTGAGASDQDDEADPTIQLLLRAGLDEGPALTAALIHMKAVRSARKEPETVSVRIDPMDGLG